MKRWKVMSGFQDFQQAAQQKRLRKKRGRRSVFQQRTDIYGESWQANQLLF